MDTPAPKVPVIESEILQAQFLTTPQKTLKSLDTSEEKISLLTAYGGALHASLGRPLTVNDFRKEGAGIFSAKTIYKYFKSLNEFFEKCGSPTNNRLPAMTDEQLKNFLGGIKEINERGCWTTSYYSEKKSRPQIKYRGKTVFLHRVSFILWKDENPKNKLILHSCDNTKCYNPAHLRLGSQAENMIDAVKRGRWATGKATRRPQTIKNPYNYKALLDFIKENCEISTKNEFLFTGPTSDQGYVKLCIRNRHYMLHRLLLANKLGKNYDDIEIACHRLPDGTKPQRHDLNPNHLFEGSLADNVYDTISYNKSFKLTVESVKKIKKDLTKRDFKVRGSKKKFDEKWAEHFFVSPNTISDIRRNTTWSIINV